MPGDLCAGPECIEIVLTYHESQLVSSVQVWLAEEFCEKSFSIWGQNLDFVPLDTSEFKSYVSGISLVDL